jgi:hypothetical protein
MTRPSIQIDNEVREMTEEEYASYLVIQAQVAELEPLEPLPEADQE